MSDPADARICLATIEPRPSAPTIRRGLADLRAPVVVDQHRSRAGLDLHPADAAQQNRPRRPGGVAERPAQSGVSDLEPARRQQDVEKAEAARLLHPPGDHRFAENPVDMLQLLFPQQDGDPAAGQHDGNGQNRNLPRSMAACSGAAPSGSRRSTSRLSVAPGPASSRIPAR